MIAKQAQSPNITIRTEMKKRHRLVLKDAWNRVLKVELRDPPAVSSNYVKFARSLARSQTMLNSFGRLEPDCGGTALAELAKAGRIFLASVLRRPKQEYEEFLTFLQVACPGWVDGRPDVPLLHIVSGKAEYFPWELLPLFDVRWNERVDDFVGLQDACRIFPAFSAIVERRFPDSEEADPCLYTTPEGRLPLRFCWNADLEGARAELGHLRTRPITLEGPYPCHGAKTAPSFVDQLTDPRLALSGGRLRHADEVLHISCHAIADIEAEPKRLEYHLADDEGKCVVIDLDDVVGEFFSSWDRAKVQGVLSLPLVFLNACGTGLMDPVSAMSLLEPFRINQNRGVIATLGNLPDRVAAKYSKAFYNVLLGPGSVTVGEALHAAKWRLLEELGNPIGMLYSLHGSSRLQVAPTNTNGEKMP